MIEGLEGIRDALRRAVPPVRVDGPQRDLWPDLVRRISGRAPGMTWLDWVAVGGAVAAALSAPAVIPTLLYLL